MALNDNLRGALFMMISMLGFAFEDVFLKFASREMPAGQVSLTVGLIGMVVFGALAKGHGEALLHPVMVSKPMLVRSVFEVIGRLFYALAIAFTPLSLTSAVLQATPLVVVAGAALFLNERVGWRRWSAISLGFIGVLVVLRPGLEGFSPLWLLAVMGTLGFAFRDLATRLAPKALSNRQLGLMGFTMLAIAGLVILIVQGGPVLPSAKGALMVAIDAVFAITAYACLTSAMRLGDVSFVSPFRYIRLIFGLILAVALFKETVDGLTLLGSGLIVVSGLYTLFRQNRRA